MKKVDSMIKRKMPTGLAAKLIRAVITIVVTLSAVYFLVSMIQVHILGHMVEHEGKVLSDTVGKESWDSMSRLTKESLGDLSVLAADKTDDELWVNAYELEIMAAQVEDIIRHPDNYKRQQIKPPDKSNQGEEVLQLLCPNGYENIDPKTMEILERLANLEPIMATYIGDYTVDFYIAMPDGTALAIDKGSADKFDEDGNIKSYDATTRPWYKEAVATKSLYFSSALDSYFYDYDIVSYSLPVYVDGELVAVLEGSLKTDLLDDRVGIVDFGESGFSILVNKAGQLVSSTRERGELAMRPNMYENIRTTINPSLCKVINKGLLGGKGVELVTVDGKKYYAGYGSLVTVGWTQIAFVSVDELMRPTEIVVGETKDSYNRMNMHVNNGFHILIVIMLVVMLVIMQMAIFISGKFARKRVEPIKHMTNRMEEISGDDMIFEMEDIYRTGDELETLAESFADQSRRLKEYMDENIRISTEKAQIDFEMSMATQIQESMLPKLSESFTERPEFELYAHMAPAKNVGGDFYDFFYLDDDHLVIEIADVSGKGITAALFMAQSMQILHAQAAMLNGDVVKAMEVANAKLSAESLIDMFVTVWLGVFTISTGELTFVDAGHEYPAIKRGDSGFVIEEDAHSIIAAAFSTAKFKKNVITLAPGDAIYLYTDGVTEAHNEEGAMLEEAGLQAALNEVCDLSPKEIDAHVRKRITEFAGKMEQYDDITTLCLRYRGRES